MVIVDQERANPVSQIPYWPPLDREYVERFSPENVPTPFAFMRFRLTYQGPLPPVQSGNRRAKEKWLIRRQINSQLADLYKQEHILSGKPTFIMWTGLSANESNAPLETPDKPRSIPHTDREFIPLVRTSMDMACDLDITLLLPGPLGSVVTKDGDLDNRLNTLFDGLKMPQPSDIGSAEGSIDQPFYCLTDDDALITSLTVRTDRYLAAPTAIEHSAIALIDVTIRVLKITPTNYRFAAPW